MLQINLPGLNSGKNRGGRAARLRS